MRCIHIDLNNFVKIEFVVFHNRRYYYTVNIKQIPSGYIKAISGLGEATPSNLLICPLIQSGETRGVIELATFKEFSKEEENYFTTLGEIINEKLSHLI